jgi:hypothetical protein
MQRRNFLTRNAVVSALLLSFNQTAFAISEELESIRTTLELIAMCAAKNDTMGDVRDYFKSTNDSTMIREWNKALERARKQMKEAAEKGGKEAISVNNRYQLSCQIVGLGKTLPIALEAALFK